MSTAYKILPHYTYEDYCRWEGSWELIEGIPHAMSPAPGLRHQYICGKIYSLLKTSLDGNSCDCQVFLPLDFKIKEDTIVQPNILIVCHPDINLKLLETVPVLVVEVLSPSTAMKDRNTKFLLYQMAGVPYYLIVDTDKQTIETYCLTNGLYQLNDNDENDRYSFNFETCTVDVMMNEIWL